MTAIDTAEWKPRVDAELTKMNAEIAEAERKLAELRTQRQSLLGAYNLLLVAEAEAAAAPESASAEPAKND